MAVPIALPGCSVDIPPASKLAGNTPPEAAKRHRQSSIWDTATSTLVFGLPPPATGDNPKLAPKSGEKAAVERARWDFWIVCGVERALFLLLEAPALSVLVFLWLSGDISASGEVGANTNLL
jgi:hypothetical protein